MQNLRFADFLSAPESTDSPETPEPVVEETQETTPPVELEEQAQPSPVARVTLEDRMRARGLAVDEVDDPEDFYDRAIDRIAEGSQALQEVQNLRAELERLKAQPIPAAPQQTPALAPEVLPGETPQQAAVRHFRELSEYDSSLLRLVERDDSGQAVPKSEYGQAAFEAARTINEYERAERTQAQLLLRNPHLLIQDNMSEIESLAEKKARAIIEERISQWNQEQQMSQKAQQEQAQHEQERQSLLQFHEEHKGKLFKMNKDGTPLRDPLNPDSFAPTPTGQYFFGRLQELRGEMPYAPQITLMKLAAREAELANNLPTPAPAPSAPEPVPTPAEQRQQFVTQREAVPHQSTPAATAAEAMAGAPKLRFAEMVRRNPQVADITSTWS